METITVERSIWIKAPRERVWRAVTDPNDIAQWFLPREMGAMMKRDTTKKIAMSFGPMDVDIAAFEVMEAPSRMTSRSLPDRLIATTYTLAEENDGTRLTVTMSGFEALPNDPLQDRLTMTGAAWEKALANLKAFVDGVELPFAQPPVAPLFGYWRETKEKVSLERSIWIKAPRERVWHALTDPAQMQKWFSPSSTFKATGSEVGSRVYVEDPESGGELYVQVIEVIDPPNHLVTRSQPEPPDVSYLTSYKLVEENNGTRLILTYSGYEALPAEARYQGMEENTFGFGMMLDNIKALLEGTPMPYPMGF